MEDEKRLYIIGAGFAGQTIADDIKRKKVFGTVKAFLDDDKNLIGKQIENVPVLGPIQEVASIMRFKKQDEAIIAIPSAPVEKIREIYEILKEAGAPKIKILPGISQVVNGSAHLVQTREIDPLDILGRTPVTISLKESLSYLRGKRVLITGAGGSIGSELARQLLSGGAERLYLFGHGENSIYQIDRELRLLQSEGVGEKAVIVPIIGDMADRAYTDYIIENTKCDVIFHCAAYKHVPLMEENPVAAIANNVFGTKNLLDAAMAHNVQRFVLISTDKAVNPVSVYGISKMLCEKLVLETARKAEEASNHLQEGKKSRQDFIFVRFGNVLGSRGSILPLFMEQIKNGGPVTVTSRNMERFFMTIPEACSLVLQAGGVGSNAQGYLLDMGEPIKILDLAEQIIKFSGLEPYKDIDIKIVGMRKGERENEPLWLKEENPEKTEFSKILKLKNIPFERKKLESLLEELKKICFLQEEEKGRSLYRNKEELLKILKSYFPGLITEKGN
ncbi:MAG: polysaccharide biosynthesis protein [Treponema sp.]|nr:polysaccharide biosynthesis protein [Treponema sp.]